MAPTLRPARREDLPGMLSIYNHYVRTSHCTFDTEPFSAAEREPWWSQFDDRRYRCFVAADGAAVTGYACSAPLKPKAAYATSVEVSAYVDPERGGEGIGRALYERLLRALADEDVHRAYALIALPNDASIRLHQSFGFEKVAHLDEVGRKFDRYWDVAWYQRAL